MDSEDGQLFIKNLAYFVRTHERALANALLSQRQKIKNGKDQTTAGSVVTSSNGPASAIVTLTEALIRPSSLFTQKIKPAKLTLTPHHLFYLLSKFEDLGVDVGPMTVRLENLHSDTAPSNYVSFLGNAPKSKGRPSDADSLKSVSSVRSVMSSMSSVWSALTLSNPSAKAEKQKAQFREDLKYLYSCFTKIPALRLAPDHRARPISGFEEFPFDTAVPLFAFKNVSALELCDLDFRQFHGWDRLSEQLRSLTVKRAGVDDPIDLLQNIVLDDMEKRRKRSSKAQMPTTPSTPGLPWLSGSPKPRYMDLARSTSAPTSPFSEARRGSYPGLQAPVRGGSSDGISAAHRQSSNSPPRSVTSRHGSIPKPPGSRGGNAKARRGSGSSSSSHHETTPRQSTSDLLAMSILPPSKWRFLRHLSLSENGLTHLTVSSLAPVAGTLQSLDLSGNLFSEIPDALASLTHLRAVNLSNCMIDSLQSLSRNPLPAITTLNLRSNRLLTLAGIERLYSLERLDLRDNRLHDPTELARLTGIPDIVDVYVVKNPFTRTHSHYRTTIFNLFRASPGHLEDITIDGLGPLHSEKKHLIDRAPELANKPVIQAPLEHETPVSARVSTITGSATAYPDTVDPFSARPTAPLAHHRSISENDTKASTRRKKTTRRRIVELSQAELSQAQQSSEEPAVTETTDPPVPDLTELPPMPHTPTTESDQPVTPEALSEHNPATLQQTTEHHGRPTLGTAFATPTRSLKIVDPSDDEESSTQPGEDAGMNSVTYRQKMEALKTEIGPNWLSVLNEERLSKSQAQNRDFSPASRTSTVRADRPPRGAGIPGRTLG